MKRKRWLSVLAFAAVGLAFVYAGALKVMDPKQFVSSILTYEIFPYDAAVLIALFVPYLEIVSGGLLAVGIWRRGASLVIGGMLTVFALLIGQAWARGLSIDCGCFGSHEATDTGGYLWALGRDALLGLGLFVGWMFGSGEKREE